MMFVSVTGQKPIIALYDETGQTKIRNLTKAVGLQWADIVSNPGSVTFSNPVADSVDLHSGRIVKVWWRGHAPVAAVLKDVEVEWCVDDLFYREYQLLPGLLDMWNRAVLHPEFGLNRRTTGTQRTFGPMELYVSSSESPWFIPGDWDYAVGARWSDAPDIKRKQPPGLSGPNPYWIASTDPFTDAPNDETDWLIREFTTYSDFPYTIYTTADDYLTLYLDGEEIVTPDQQNAQSLFTLVSVSGLLQAGRHKIAAKVSNASYNSNHNPVGFIFALVQMDAKGNPVKGPPVLISDPRWLATSTNPGRNAASVVLRAHSEAVTDGVRGCIYLTPSWNGHTDTAGHAWTDKGIFTLPIAEMGLGDIATQQAENEFDCRARPSAMKVDAYKRLGSDKSATVKLDYGRNGGGLISYREKVTSQHPNRALLHLNDGTWIQRDNTSGVSADGPIEIGVSLGSTPDSDTAAEVIDAAFADIGNPTQSFVIEISTVQGVQPYVHFFPGDSIGAPDPHNGGFLKIRVLGITIDASDYPVKAYLQVVVDNT
jgi:hypothetical protein